MRAMLVLLGILMVSLPAAAGDQQAVGPGAAESAPFQLGPPTQSRPVVVRARFDLHDINDISDLTESFELTGVMTLTWHDPRQAFDPAAAGVTEKIYQGAYQVGELAPGWFPQVVLVNESGLFQKSGALLRVRSDGTSTLVETVNAVAETEFDMHRFPFDRQTLDAQFEVLGFGRDDVVLEVATGDTDLPVHHVGIPQWKITDGRLSAGTRSRRGGDASVVSVSVDVERESFYVRRLVTLPLGFIVLLSFSVFWMDRSSLGDRLSVSFIGILTGVTYQIVMSGLLPPISYITLMHGFLTLSFFTMCAAVVVNLVAGRLDQMGRSALSDRIDRWSRWVFPLGYSGLILLMVLVAITFY